MEIEEQSGLSKPRKGKQPHQVALWVTVVYIALVYFCPYLFGRPLGEKLFLVFSYFSWPGLWLSQALGLGFGWTSIFVPVCGLLATYFTIYIPVKLWKSSSHHMHIALVSCVAMSLVMHQLLQWYSKRIDWTSRGLNPNRPGFQPQVLVLSGTFDYWFKDSLINQTKSGKAFFEIRMRGHDYYYCRKWRGTDWRVGSWFRVEIATNGTGYSWGLASLSHTTRGTGGSRSGDNLVAQRLWNGAQFVGADSENLITGFTPPNRQEEFFKLVKAGPWLIPKHIRLTEGTQRVENYYIKKIEFWSTPTTNWFGQVVSKYSDHNSELRSKDLGEPGVAPGKRK